MVDHESASATWVCPECQRRVPRKVATCRCGFTQADVAAQEIIGEPAPASRSGAPAVARTATALVVVLAGSVWWFTRGPAPQLAAPAVMTKPSLKPPAGVPATTTLITPPTPSPAVAAATSPPPDGRGTAPSTLITPSSAALEDLVSRVS